MKRTPTRIIPKSNLVEPTDVLVCARVLKELPDARLVDANFQFFKLALLEDGRMLGYADELDYVLVANLHNDASACRFRENLVRHPVSDLRMCDTPADASMLVKPWGLVAPESIKGRRNNNLDGDCDRNTLNARVHPPYGIQSFANCPACSSGPPKHAVNARMSKDPDVLMVVLQK